MDDVKKLEEWNQRVLEIVKKFGLDCFLQDFEICDHEEMIGYMVYSGMPSHYPHWSYGKSFERTKVLYDYGISGLPYEMVINCNPSIAYLMRDNSELLQLLTIAHVYGHNDFFKNNFTFKSTRPEYTVEMFKVHANRVRKYIEDPFIGLEKVENIIDAAHAISMQQTRNLASPRLSRADQEERVRDGFRLKKDPYGDIHKREEFDEEGYKKAMFKNPLEPDNDLLLFIRDNNHRLSLWEKDLLTIVHEEARYFIPQIDTKIMNEGWASFWHHKIISELDLPQGMKMEFNVRHSQVLRPNPGQINPYFLGFKIWEDIEKRWNKPSKEDLEENGISAFEKNGKKITGLEKIFTTREIERDASFLRRYLTEDLMRELDFFYYVREKDNKIRIKSVADKENWMRIKDKVIQGVGTGSIPVIKVEDANFGDKPILLLKHYHDGRDLQAEYSQRTLEHVKKLWGGKVTLETILKDEKVYCYVDENGKYITKRKT